MAQYDAPIPGQSLTSDKDSPMPYETPPEFTDKDELIRTVFNNITEPENISKISEALQDGASVEAITKVLLFSGMAEGKMNPDMQILMAEPIVYMILFIAERIGIDPVMTDDENLTPDLENEIAGLLKMSEEEVGEIKEKVPPSLLDKINIPKETQNGN